MPDIEDKHHFPISIMSNEAIKRLTNNQNQECFLKYKNIPSMQTIFVQCLQELGIKVIREKAFHITEPSHDFDWNADPCKRPLGISQLSMQNMQYLYMSRPATGISSNGDSYKWDTIVTYSDVFHHTFASLGFSPGIDRHSPATSTVHKTKSGLECMNLCKTNLSCVSWTFDHQNCYLSDTVGVAIPRDS